MKINKFILLVLMFFTTNTFAHSVPGIKLEVKNLKNNTILITGKFKKSGKNLIGNKIKLISMIDNRVLFEDKLSFKGLITSIPNESYWIYLIIRDNDVVMTGPAPLEGFKTSVKKEPKAFIYTLSASLIFLFLSIILMVKAKRQKTKERY